MALASKEYKKIMWGFPVQQFLLSTLQNRTEPTHTHTYKATDTHAYIYAYAYTYTYTYTYTNLNLHPHIQRVSRTIAQNDLQNDSTYN